MVSITEDSEDKIYKKVSKAKVNRAMRYYKILSYILAHGGSRNEIARMFRKTPEYIDELVNSFEELYSKLGDR